MHERIMAGWQYLRKARADRHVQIRIKRLGYLEPVGLAVLRSIGMNGIAPAVVLPSPQ